MRIVSGIYRGRTLLELKGNAIRPTSDMVRESLFNIIQFKIAGKDFLDLFCGTGAVGIEAMSRGANHVTFNDFSRESIALVKKNLEKIGATDGFDITMRDGAEFYRFSSQKYHFVFIDPPYASDLGQRTLQNASELLTDDGVAIFESEKPFTDNIKGLKKVNERKYGRVYLTFFEKENS